MRMNEATKKLCKLVKENPELPVYALCSSTIFDEDFDYYGGIVSSASLDEIVCIEQHVLSYSEAKDDPEEFAIRYASKKLFDEWQKMDESTQMQEIRKWVDSLAWTKCIVIWVNEWE